MKKDTAHPLFFTGFFFSLFFCFVTACNPPVIQETVSGKNTNTLETRLQMLEDREEIRHLLINYGRHLDRRDFESFSQLFAEEDGEWVGGMGKARGRQAILKLMEEKIGGDTGEFDVSSFHLFTNDRIDLDGDTATASTKWVFVIQDETGRPLPLYLGHYEDRLIREQGQWKFLKRVAYSDIPKDIPEQ